MSGAAARGLRPRRTLFGAALALFFFVFVHPDPEHPAVARTLALAVWMAFYWLSDAVPMAVTALLPVVVLPLAGVMSTRDVAPLYANNIIFLFLGGFLLAAAMQRSNLHRRVALGVVARVGSSPSRLLFGFMFATWLLSGWVSNTATALMMVPIVMALTSRLGSSDERLAVALLLGVAYAASIGGMATLIGTPPNLALARIYSESFPDRAPLEFLPWMLFAVPMALVLVTVTFGWLRWRLLRGLSVESDREMLTRERVELGPWSRDEKLVGVAFVLFAAALITRGDATVGPVTLYGWARRVGLADSVFDGTVAMAVALSLYVLPSCRGGALLRLEDLRTLPWDIVILLGGGFALAKSFVVSGLSAWIGGQLSGLHGVPTPLMVLSICLLLTFLTEITSNTATTQVILPVLAALSLSIGVDPLLLMVPAALSASCAFMLPVATPPNAIVCGTGELPVRQMIRAGLVLNLVGALVLTALTLTLAKVVLGI